jgi:hypothetical protein
VQYLADDPEIRVLSARTRRKMQSKNVMRVQCPAMVAQLVHHSTADLEVQGSIPGTTRNPEKKDT